MNDPLVFDKLFHSRSAWLSLAPAIGVVVYVVLALPVYLVRTRGQFYDAELQARGSSARLGMRARLFFSWLVSPAWQLLLRMGVPAQAVTMLSVLLAFGAGVSVAAGYFAAGGWLFLLAGICDFFDGKMARATGQAGPRGAALDSVIDRYAELAFLSGLAWFYRGEWALLATLGALTGSMLVPYVRARGEGLGARFPNVGFMQRPERIVVLGLAVALSPVLATIVASAPGWPYPLAVAGLCLVAVGTHVTALQRLIYLLQVLGPRRHAIARVFGQGSMFRNAVSAGTATGIDFSIVTMLVAVPWFGAPTATLVGCAVGGVVNFTMNRVWTFRAGGSYVRQGGRYAFVSATSALLNAGGVAVLLLLPSMDYRIAWVLVRVAVFAAWNYPLHRNYVFTTADEAEGESNLAGRRGDAA